MDAARQKRLEALGWKFYEHAGDVFGMTEAEKHEMDFRKSLADAVRKRREKLGLSEKELAARLKISLTKFRRLEMGMWDIPVENILAAFSVMGGRIGITELPPLAKNGVENRAKPKKRARATAS